MDNNETALEKLARAVVFGNITRIEIKELGFSIKKDQTIAHVLQAKKLKAGQRTGGLDEMMRHVQKNLIGKVTKI